MGVYNRSASYRVYTLHIDYNNELVGVLKKMEIQLSSPLRLGYWGILST